MSLWRTGWLAVSTVQCAATYIADSIIIALLYTPCTSCNRQLSSRRFYLHPSSSLLHVSPDRHQSHTSFWRRENVTVWTPGTIRLAAVFAPSGYRGTDDGWMTPRSIATSNSRSSSISNSDWSIMRRVPLAINLDEGDWRSIYISLTSFTFLSNSAWHRPECYTHR